MLHSMFHLICAHLNIDISHFDSWECACSHGGKVLDRQGHGEGIVSHNQVDQAVRDRMEGSTRPGQEEGVISQGQGEGSTRPGQGDGVVTQGQGEGIDVQGQAEGSIRPGQGEGVVSQGQGEGIDVQGQGKGSIRPGQGEGLVSQGQGEGMDLQGYGVRINRQIIGEGISRGRDANSSDLTELFRFLLPASVFIQQIPIFKKSVALLCQCDT